MSTYIKASAPLEFDNAPDWLIAYMRYRRTMLGNTPSSVMTDFKSVREYFQWLKYFQENNSSPLCTEDLRTVNITTYTLMDAVNVKRALIETYLFFCADTLGNEAATRQKKLVAIRSFYNYVLDQEDVLHTELEYNPAERIRNPKTPKRQPVFLPEDACKAFLDAIRGENGPRDYALFLLMLSTGLRVSEVVNISLKDTNLTSKTIKIHGKGNKERTVYLTDAVVTSIQHNIDEYRVPAKADTSLLAPLFISKRTGTGLTTRSVERAMDKYILKAGIGGMGYTPHKLRHTFATVLSKTASASVVQSALGHANLNTSQIYIHLGQNEVQNAVRDSAVNDFGS